VVDERDVDGRLSAAVKERGGLCLKLDSMGMKGIQDRLVLLPGARVFFVELKRPTGGRVSVLQKVRQTQIARLGFPSVVIRSPLEVDRLAHEWDALE